MSACGLTKFWIIVTDYGDLGVGAYGDVMTDINEVYAMWKERGEESSVDLIRVDLTAGTSEIVPPKEVALGCIQHRTARGYSSTPDWLADLAEVDRDEEGFDYEAQKREDYVFAQSGR